MPKTIPALFLTLCLGLTWAAPAGALVTIEDAEKEGIRPGQKTAPQKPPAAPPAGTIRTEDGKVFTVPKAKDKGQNDGGGAKEQ
ncbi:MAG: hypothetical protein AB1916_00070 [Thermodesulfobacteriota bacterium]